MKIFGYTLAQIKKAVITGLGFVIAVLTAATQGNFVPEERLPLALGVIGFCTSALVFIVKNAPLEEKPTNKPAEAPKPV